MSFLVRHAPHIVPTLVGFGVVVWLWAGDARARRRRGAEPSAPPAPPAAPAPTAGAERSPPPVRVTPTVPAVRLSAARRGVLVLGPILAAVATGVVVYGIDLGVGGRFHPSRGLAWTHAGVSVLVCLLGAYKLADVQWGRLREGWRPARALAVLGSLAVAALLVPLLVTGVALLVAPSASSPWAYAHLVAAAWWTALVLWHLKRYAGGALRALRGGDGTVPKTWSQRGELTP